MTDAEALGLRLKESRFKLATAELRSVSPEALGLRVGVAGQSISRYEGGRREPDLAMIRKLSAVLRVSPGWLAFGDAAMAVPEQPPAVTARRGSTPISGVKQPRPAEAKRAKRKGA